METGTLPDLRPPPGHLKAGRVPQVQRMVGQARAHQVGRGKGPEQRKRRCDSANQDRDGRLAHAECHGSPGAESAHHFPRSFRGSTFSGIWSTVEAGPE